MWIEKHAGLHELEEEGDDESISSSSLSSEYCFCFFFEGENMACQPLILRVTDIYLDLLLCLK